MTQRNSSDSVNCKSFEVFFLPRLMPDSDLSDAVVVMTDVLRASTTMLSALAAGAATIWPHATIESARYARAQTPDSLLCGEREGKIIEGFDCGNSPREFSRLIVAGKTIVHCTTNGTGALESCRGAARVLIGAFVNLDAVLQQLGHSDRAIVLCAGTDGEVTGEDVLFAGTLANGLRERNSDLVLNDQAQISLGYWNSAQSRIRQGESLFGILAGCRGGGPLVDLGYSEDIEFCAQLSIFEFVPELDQTAWRIGQA